MRLVMLGTGNAHVTECYNTCYVFEDNNQYFLVDGGGGSSLMRQIKHAGISWTDIKEIFVTHKHMDHLLGILWIVRTICQHMGRGLYEGEVYLYGHDEVIQLIREICGRLLSDKEYRFLDDRLHLIVLEDGEQRSINGRIVTFFDIHSKKVKQFGFCMELEHGKRLVCCGDEPYNPSEERYVRGCEWLLHEAFCLDSEAVYFQPYETHHATVRDICKIAEEYKIPNLLLYHTEDKNIADRKRRYTEEGSQYYSGNLLIPDDLETILI